MLGLWDIHVLCSIPIDEAKILDQDESSCVTEVCKKHVTSETGGAPSTETAGGTTYQWSTIPF